MVLPADDAADALLDAFRGPGLTAVMTADGGVEEVFQLKGALGGVHVLVAGHPADRRFVHAEILGHISEDKGLEKGDAFFKKIVLKLEQRFHHPVDGALPLMDAFYQPKSGF